MGVVNHAKSHPARLDDSDEILHDGLSQCGSHSIGTILLPKMVIPIRLIYYNIPAATHISMYQ